MIDISKGRYWDLPLSWVDGCTPCSPGCDHCWAAGISQRFRPFKFTTNDYGNRFMGCIKTHPERLSIPLKRRKPTVYAIWNDWAHEEVPGWFQQKMILTALKAEQHTILALTKRPQIALNFFNWYGNGPPSNWWTGLTVCNQQEWDENGPIFMQIPGRKFISHEPALGTINFHLSGSQEDVLWRRMHGGSYERSFIACLISGGETGRGARPSHPDIFRADRGQ